MFYELREIDTPEPGTGNLDIDVDFPLRGGSCPPSRGQSFS
jgi:hypothetical protein